jgi:hypothetical protein
MCRIGRDSECKLHGCAFELLGDVNCKNYIEKPILPVFKTPIKKVKKQNNVKKLPPIKKSDLEITEYVYNRSNGICYICGENINKDEFRIYHSITVKYTSKQNLYKGIGTAILRAKHRKCKQI